MSVLRRQFLVASAAVLAAPARAESAALRVAMTTAIGVILIDLAADRAPITSANFLRYVDEKRLDGGCFYRAMRTAPAPPAGLIQGGVQNDPTKVLPPIAHESTTKTGLRHTDGVISMARYDPGTAASEFFVCVGAQPSLDADPSAPGDNQGFAAFGYVVQGMDVVRGILASPVSQTKGEGVMRGEMLDPTIAIVTVRRAGV